MRYMSISLITLLFSLSLWAQTSNSPRTTSTTHPSGYLTPSEESTFSGSAGTTDVNGNWINQQDDSRLSGSSSESAWIGRDEEVSAESKRMSSGSSLSGSSSMVPFGNTMNDQDKAMEMCRALNPDRNCVDVVRNCSGQANLETCMQRNANR